MNQELPQKILASLKDGYTLMRRCQSNQLLPYQLNRLLLDQTYAIERSRLASTKNPTLTIGEAEKYLIFNVNLTNRAPTSNLHQTRLSELPFRNTLPPNMYASIHLQIDNYMVVRSDVKKWCN